MKKIFLLAVLGFGVLASCKKHNAAGGVTNFDSQHLTCKIDGQAFTFNANLQATRNTIGAVTTIAITGYTAQTGNNIQGLGVGWSNSPTDTIFGTGLWIDTSHLYTVFGVYDATSTDAWESGTNTTGQATWDGITITDRFYLNITYVDSTGVKGTFGGDFYDSGTIPGTKKVITSGDFVARWK